MHARMQQAGSLVFLPSRAAPLPLLLRGSPASLPRGSARSPGPQEQRGFRSGTWDEEQGGGGREDDPASPWVAHRQAAAVSPRRGLPLLLLLRARLAAFLC